MGWREAVLASVVCLLQRGCVSRADDTVDIAAPFPHTEELTPQALESTSGPVVVMFYAPWCENSKAAAGMWRELAEAAATNNAKLSMGKFDITQDDADDLVDRLGISSLPTIMLFEKGIEGGVVHHGHKNLKGVQTWLSSRGFQTMPVLPPKVESKEEEEPHLVGGGTGKVVTLGERSFDGVAMDHSLDVFVRFHAPWCGHCRSMEKDWVALAEELKGRSTAVIADVDADRHKNVGRNQHVSGFPTLRLYTKRDKLGLGYHDERNVDKMLAFFNQHTQ